MWILIVVAVEARAKAPPIDKMVADSETTVIGTETDTVA
jgi:hypothetical protein